ncbi:MAG TPA: hemerythrin domain-containing protein [Vicinamibacterales bacterium]|nr:hemerythrin domain-containing protein [Vicinamibacterales bacterium]
MPIKIGQRADHGFDEPLGLLSDCHRRIEHFLATLVMVTKARGGGALPDPDRRALEAALRYFDTAAPRHSADEEESLFPRLRAAAGSATQPALDALRRLEGDHREAERHHEQVSQLVRQWLSNGTLPEGEVQILTAGLATLERLYRDHIAVEDHEVFPAAGRVLSPADLEAVGREMAARRGVAFAPWQSHRARGANDPSAG